MEFLISSEGLALLVICTQENRESFQLSVLKQAVSKSALVHSPRWVGLVADLILFLVASGNNGQLPEAT
jgi:hypothetical protein